LPDWIQPVAWALPPTAVFEGMRALVIDHVFRADLMLWAFGLNLLWLAAGAVSFMLLLNAARRGGSLLQIGE
jgi:ABC-2 type transport system permease protein